MLINTENIQDLQIPMIDLEGYINGQPNTAQVAKALRAACKHLGFFYIKNHGVPMELQNQIFENMREFFQQSRQVKNQIHMRKNQKSGTGYFGFGEQYTNGKIDIKEGIYFSQELDPNHHRVLSNFPLHGNNIFPESPPKFKQNTLLWMKHMNKIGEALLEALAESLQLERSYLKQGMYKEHLQLLSMFHYPYDATRDPNSWAVGQHTDYGLLIILMTSDKGLQVKSVTGQWLNIDPIENTFIVNIGDTLEKLTKGLYKSTIHRVRNTQGVSRYSIPFFFDPGWDFQIEELEFKVSEQEQAIMKKNQQQQRPDKSKLSDLHGKYGKYLMKKLCKTLPYLQKYKQYNQ